MVKEVEFANFLEIVNTDTHNLTKPNFISNYLQDDGKELMVTIKGKLPSVGTGGRAIMLYYNNIDFSNKLTDLILLGDMIIDDASKYTDTSDLSYKFDLSKVLVIPKKIYNAQGISEIVIELYTYEANITTDYGTKRLSVPYSIMADSKFEYAQSTDGVFKLFIVEAAAWDPSLSYGLDDIVFFSDTFYTSVSEDNLGNSPSTSDKWKVSSNEDMLNYAYGTTTFQPLLSIGADMLISRYAKYAYILEALKSTNYKANDDEIMQQKVKTLQLFREKAMFELNNHKPIYADYWMHQLRLAFSKLADKTSVVTTNIKYTL